MWYIANIPRLRSVSRHSALRRVVYWPYTTPPQALLLNYGLDPANGIDMTTASESAGRQIQNNTNLKIKIPQTLKYFTPF